MPCTPATCSPHMIFSATVVLIIWISVLALIYVVVLYDTIRNHSNDLLSWRNSQLQLITNEQYVPTTPGSQNSQAVQEHTQQVLQNEKSALSNFFHK